VGTAASAAATIDVLVPRYSGRVPRPGIRVRRTATLDDEDRTTHRGLPVTAPARTLADLAAVLPQTALERAITEAEIQQLDVHDRLQALVAARSGRPGAAKLARALGHAGTVTRSVLEERFLALCDAHAVPRPEANVLVGGLEVDFLWRQAGVVVETDGYAFHGTRAAFERDRARDAALLGAGLRVVRVTHRRLTQEPEAVAGLLRRLVAVS
jgi:very-short-patch-repair endonuclease